MGRSAMRVLVIRPGGLGDLLLALPALAHLAERLRAEIEIAGDPERLALLEGSSYCTAALSLERLGLHPLFTSDPPPELLVRLRAYDAIVSWFGAGDHTYHAHLKGLGRPVVVARTLPPPGVRMHVSRYLLDTLAPLLPVPQEIPRVRLAVTDVERREAEAWCRARGMDPARLVLLHPGAGGSAKRWPADRFGALIGLLREAKLSPVVVAGPADGEAVRELHAAVAGERLVVAPDLALRPLAALSAIARSFVGNDSGLTHLAAVAGTPTLALFGPTDPAVWAPLGPASRVLAARPVAGDPWHGLSPERVLTALLDLVGAGGRAAPAA